jgi:hypothetical protein
MSDSKHIEKNSFTAISSDFSEAVIDRIVKLAGMDFRRLLSSTVTRLDCQLFALSQSSRDF